MIVRVVFMGSSDVSCVVMQALLAAPDIALAGVVTQPDRPCGRRRQIRPCLCKAAAESQGLKIVAPIKLNVAEVLAQLESWRPDVIVVAAYGQFLGRRILELPALGCLNVHLSLLPRFRGAAPVQHAIAAGDSETGVTIIKMDAGMDSGDILMQEREAILPDDTAGALQERLSARGAALLLRCLPAWQAGSLVPRPQNSDEVTFAPKIKKEEGEIDWRLPAAALALRVRAFTPRPGCYAWLKATRGGMPAQRLKLLQVAPEATSARDIAPGTVVEAGGAGPAIATGAGWLRLLRVQREGGRALDGRSFLRGCTLKVGQPLTCPEGEA